MSVAGDDALAFHGIECAYGTPERLLEPTEVSGMRIRASQITNLTIASIARCLLVIEYPAKVPGQFANAPDGLHR